VKTRLAKGRVGLGWEKVGKQRREVALSRKEWVGKGERWP
jgi:hypothetical protein